MGLIGGMARTAVVAGTATAVSNRVSRRQADRWAQQDQQAYAQQQQYAPPPQQYAPPPPEYAAPPPPAPAPPPVVVVQSAPTPAAADAGMDVKLQQLQQLGELKAQGILSDAEFEAQKAKILSS